MAIKNNKIDYSVLELKETLIHTKSVSKTVKGGRIRRFSALVVVGDGNGHVGYGLGKAAEVPDAIRKAFDEARKNIVHVSLKGTTIPHEIIGEFGAGRVLLKPAAPGTGIIAGGALRAVFECLGVQDVVVKSQGSNNPNNMIRAAFLAFAKMNSPKTVAARRGKTVAEIIAGRDGKKLEVAESAE